MSQTILDLLSQDATIATLSGVAVGLFLFLVKVDRTRRIVQKTAHLAYDVVSALKASTPTKIDDKAAVALKVITDRLDRELKPAEVALAKAAFDARHATEKTALAMAARLAQKGTK